MNCFPSVESDLEIIYIVLKGVGYMLDRFVRRKRSYRQRIEPNVDFGHIGNENVVEDEG